MYLFIFYFYISRYPYQVFAVPQGTAKPRLGITGLDGSRQWTEKNMEERNGLM
jgi:hypothetical protein